MSHFRIILQRQRLLLCGLATAFSLAGSATAEQVTITSDVSYPSGGSGYERVLTPGQTIQAELDTADVVAPQSSVPDDPGTPLTPSPTLLFTGMIQLDTIATGEGFIYKPPDTHAAVGPGAGAMGRVVEVTNQGVEIFDKASASVAGPVDLDEFTSRLGITGVSALGAANLCFDPKVLYDQHSGRFFIVILDGRTPDPGGRSNVIICTSKTSTPGSLTTTDWSAESASALTTFVGGMTWFDYPGIGADSTRLVVTGNMFDAGGVQHGTKIRVFLKSSLTDDGVPAGATFNDIDIDATVTAGASTIQPAHVFGATLNGDFHLINRFGSTAYRMWQITGAGGAATLAGGTPSLTAWTAGTQIAAAFAPQILDGINDEPTIDHLSARIMNAMYRGDSVWCTLSADIDSDSRTEVVWFEVDPNVSNTAVAGTFGGTSVSGSGFIDGSVAGAWTYMPSIMENTSGDVAICYSESDLTKAVEMRVTTHYALDAPGTFQSPVVVATGAGEYDDFGAPSPGTRERWGDYSACVVDPDDDETFWIANEVCQSAVTAAGNDGRWGTRIAELGAVVPVELSEFNIE